MWKNVISLDASHMDMVYFQLRFLPRVHFISVYIPPSDSPYFCLSNLAWMSGKIQDNPTDHFLVMGDTNTRFGPILGDFSKNNASARSMFFTYPAALLSERPNANGRFVADALSPLVVVNGLSTYTRTFMYSDTFRRGSQWVSQLDYCFVSPAVVDAISSFEINNDTSLPSNHAPISVSFDIRALQQPDREDEQLLEQANNLGEVMHSLPKSHSSAQQRQIKEQSVDLVTFSDLLEGEIPPNTTVVSEDELESAFIQINNVMRSCAEKAEVKPDRHSRTIRPFDSSSICLLK